jgi:hypothetical protein
MIRLLLLLFVQYAQNIPKLYFFIFNYNMYNCEFLEMLKNKESFVIRKQFKIKKITPIRRL